MTPHSASIHGDAVPIPAGWADLIPARRAAPSELALQTWRDMSVAPGGLPIIRRRGAAASDLGAHARVFVAMRYQTPLDGGHNRRNTLPWRTPQDLEQYELIARPRVTLKGVVSLEEGDEDNHHSPQLRIGDADVTELIHAALSVPETPWPWTPDARPTLEMVRAHAAQRAALHVALVAPGAAERYSGPAILAGSYGGFSEFTHGSIGTLEVGGHDLVELLGARDGEHVTLHVSRVPLELTPDEIGGARWVL